ncbi:hypothetical protein PTSG_12340 [Salpingoeca rosetta]|uniref:Uncharacterized protein n=1 Tax=Salpingoeca rosetta (strain ATCC 50818 / BSB-021) TaxID=946362 RepID=F2UBR4_SALR5|nr:uncharacterized protein PTSG_12340 [Salpingoeca rosetta]EGD73930.1 hypothetical protein PTSG_12340 [Salpingoeca rosetta]|eukprot:XP_004993493.1 hypothetical protein PTSG_12340 [Salpingoeca rosetta]
MSWSVGVREDEAGGRTDIRVRGGEARDHIAAYLEYRQLVGDADGGVLMTPAEYERYKAKLKAEGKYREPQKRSAGRRKMTEAEEMAFYEKRYQERRKRERELARQGRSERAGVAAVMANGIPLALQDMYQQLELMDPAPPLPLPPSHSSHARGKPAGSGTSRSAPGADDGPVMPWDCALVERDTAAAPASTARRRAVRDGKKDQATTRTRAKPAAQPQNRQQNRQQRQQRHGRGEGTEKEGTAHSSRKPAEDNGSGRGAGGGNAVGTAVRRPQQHQARPQQQQVHNGASSSSSSSSVTARRATTPRSRKTANLTPASRYTKR